MTPGVAICEETPLQDDVRALIAELNDAIDAQEPDTPLEFRFQMTAEQMAGPETTTFVARLDGRAVGCAAVRRHAAGLAEVKRMYLRTDARGRGIADLLLAAVEEKARSEGFGRLSLETGLGFHAARKVYERAGFEVCGPFADYPDSGYAAFYTKILGSDGAAAAVSRTSDESRP